METMGLCKDCERREWCKTPCAKVNDLLWKDNRVMERHYEDMIVCYPQNKEVHFSELKPHQLDNFSTDDVVPWKTDDLRLRKSTVFVERFFNKVPCKELAERFNIKENTIVCMYKQAVDQIKKVVKAMDSRREGLKAVRPDKFNDDQKFFLLVSVFGFSQAEVARMFKRDKNMLNKKVKRLSEKYEAAFSGFEIKDEIPIDDPPMPDKLTRPHVVNLVEKYTEQGLTHKEAFKRIAERYQDIVGRPVNFRGIESKYYKAMAA